ncbi:WYL domain-containing protein [Clostridium sp. YIM B02555]|uniref:WYL domain-containing protein n=1 Tax=Clostridium sp. YIM B02555 TaxID=2911968 RepID=UPI0031B61179
MYLIVYIFYIIISLPEDEWLYSYILSFGTTLQVIEPISVLNEFANRLESMANKYHS